MPEALMSEASNINSAQPQAALANGGPREPVLSEPAQRQPAQLKAAVITFGCKVNQFESASLAGALAQAGYQAAAPEDSDLVVVNTCAVTEAAGLEAMKTIRRLRRRLPGAVIVATGCLAQLSPELLAEGSFADLVLGQADKADLLDHLAALSPGSGGPKMVVSPSEAAIRDFGDPRPLRTRAFHKIQDGCSAGCAYCAVPLARGRSRSAGAERVLAGLASYLDRGVREVVLTGVHLGHWGLDLPEPSNLGELIELIDQRLGERLKRARLRLSSLEPLEIPLVATALAQKPWLAAHLHAPIQSGSDKILAAMGRPYRAAQAEALLIDLKAAVPDLNLGTDLLSGFPGETEKDFMATVAMVERLPFGRLHVFPFSPRQGTKAADLPGQLPLSVKRERVGRLRRLSEAKAAEFLASQLGRPRMALVEGVPRRHGRPKVLTDNYIRALLPEGSPAKAGELVEVILTGPGPAPDLAEAVLAQASGPQASGSQPGPAGGGHGEGSS
jgi:threonylcarbamoyladenosine tRNA methylthiotransferase MtaB